MNEFKSPDKLKQVLAGVIIIIPNILPQIFQTIGPIIKDWPQNILSQSNYVSVRTVHQITIFYSNYCILTLLFFHRFLSWLRRVSYSYTAVEPLSLGMWLSGIWEIIKVWEIYTLIILLKWTLGILFYFHFPQPVIQIIKSGYIKKTIGYWINK